MDSRLIRPAPTGVDRSRRVPTSPLTRREVEVLQQVAHGHQDAAIAVLLDLSVHTVRRYLVNAREKLLAAHRREAVAVAADLGIITIRNRR